MTEYPQTQGGEKFSNFHSSGFFYVSCSEVTLTPSKIQVGETQGLVIHNNIANLISSTDMNCISAMQFAGEVLQVENIVLYAKALLQQLKAVALIFSGIGCSLLSK